MTLIKTRKKHTSKTYSAKTNPLERFLGWMFEVETGIFIGSLERIAVWNYGATLNVLAQTLEDWFHQQKQKTTEFDR